MADHLPTGGWAVLTPEFTVSDLAVSLEFWRDVLGFRIVFDRPERNFAYLERGGAQIMLSANTDGWNTGKLEQPLGRGINFQIMVDDLNPILDAVRAKNWPLFQDVKDVWYRVGDQEAGNREFLVQDPDGYLLRFAEDMGMRECQN